MAEKLREWEALQDEEPYDGPCRYGSHAAVMDALPEIIALVAAAERVASYDDIHTWKRDGETTAMPELANPLAALDAALSNDKEGE